MSDERADLVSPQQIEADCVCFNTQRAARAIARLYDAAFRPVGLTSGQFSILASLNQDSAVSIGTLADILKLERTTLTRNLKSIEAAGLVRSAADENDGRVRMIALTAAGRAKLVLAMPRWRAAQQRSRALIGPDRWTGLQPGLARLSTGSG